MIILKTLTWSNLFSYSSGNSIELSTEPITQLVGFNGHGKSSIPLILEEVLFNKNSKGIKKADVLNRLLDTNKYSASCTFSIDDVDYEFYINRSGATQKVKLLENSVDISSHTATATFSQIEQLFGIDGKTFSQLVYQNSASSLQFLTATDSNRKKFLIELLSLDRYISIFEMIKVVYKEVNDILLTTQGKESTIRSWLNNAAKIQLEELDIVPLPLLDSSKSSELSTLQAKLSDIVSINSRINSNNLYKSIVGEIDPQSLISTLHRLDESPIVKKRTEISLKLRQQDAIIKKYSGVSSGICPTCTQTINTEKITNIISTAKGLVSELSKTEKQLSEELLEIQRNNAEVSKHQELVQNFERYSILIDSTLPEITLDKSTLETQIKELSTYIQNINNLINKISKDNNSVSAHNAKVASIREQLSNYTTSLNEITKELDILTKKLSTLEILKKAFSTTGLIAYKIENSVKELEELTNNYLAELSDGRFELLFVLTNDKLNVVIVDNGREIEITALSAGELARVTTATLLAIRKLMSSLSKNKINVLFLDETLDVLDMEGKERLIEVLLKEETLNTFIISHSYSHPLVKKLQVIKENGISRIDNG